MRNPRDIRWAAGVFEGEGWCGAYERRRGGKVYIGLQVGVGSSDLDVIQEVQRVFKCGHINGPYEGEDGNKPMYLWRTSAEDEVRAVLMRLTPYLCGRRYVKAHDTLSATTGRVI